MGFFDFLKSDDPEPQLIIENAPPTKRTQRRKKDTTNFRIYGNWTVTKYFKNS